MYKTGLGALFATRLDIFRDKVLKFSPELMDFEIEQGIGNLHLFKTTYPWNYKTNEEFKEEVKRMPVDSVSNTLYLCDEADDVFPARDYGEKKQKDTLRRISRHGKLDDIFIYTFQEGDPLEPLLGVDRILRGLTRVKIIIERFDKKTWTIVFTVKNYLVPGIRPYKDYIRGLDQYLEYWDTKEPVI